MTGKEIRVKTYPLGRAPTSNISRHYLKCNDQLGIEKSLECATALNAIGRTGELGYVNYEACSYNPIADVLGVCWSQKKNSIYS